MSETAPTINTRVKWRSLSILAVAEVMAMSVWFSATAVVPALKAEAGLSDTMASLYASAVGAGFVVGTLTSAVLALADRFDPRRIFFVAALMASAANGALLLVEPTSELTILFRFLTGMAMAGLYPIGMKIFAGWARRDMGLLIGLLIGALTLGTAAPHLFNGLAITDWRFTIGCASVLALAAAFLVGLVKLGPGHAVLGPDARKRAFRPEYALRAWTDKAVRLANFGYLGHMVELYVMWAWVGLFFHASFRAWAGPGAADPAALDAAAALATFGAIAAGTVGCLIGGIVADRVGRTATTIGAMAISGLCTLTIGLLFGGDPVWLIVVALIWGATIVADSGQFSSSILELTAPETRGTIVTVQTSLGFLLTLGMIHLLSALVEWIGWRYAFAPFAIGPVLGIWAMARLRAHPDAVKLANGRR